MRDNVYANAYAVDLSKGGFTLHHYVIEFYPNQDNKRTRLALVKEFVEPQFRFPLNFDGMNGWSRHNINAEEIDFVGKDRDGNNVTMKVRWRLELPSDSPTTKQMVRS